MELSKFSLNYIMDLNKIKKHPTPYYMWFERFLLLTGDERIELPPKVLETPIIPFDQSPKFIKMTYKIRHLLYIILVKLTSTFYL